MRTIETVKSKDGTSIAFERLGHGPPLVMVHGTTLDHTRWGTVVTKLAERFSLTMVDRRGRGKSGDGPVYAIDREFEDVAAVLEVTPVPACLLAHSYGAICELEASRLTTRIAKMVLYEPPLPLPDRGLIFPADLAQRLAALLAAGKREAVVEGFLREVLQLDDSDIERLRRSSSWPVRIQAAHTIPREVSIANTYHFHAGSFAHVRVPTLFLVGSISPNYMHAATAMASAAVAGSRVEELRGQGHSAMSTGPEIFVESVLGFLEECASAPSC
jgi:pimeloyl-ACP methyl ester carboxylesterase